MEDPITVWRTTITARTVPMLAANAVLRGAGWHELAVDERPSADVARNGYFLTEFARGYGSTAIVCGSPSRAAAMEDRLMALLREDVLRRTAERFRLLARRGRSLLLLPGQDPAKLFSAIAVASDGHPVCKAVARFCTRRGGRVIWTSKTGSAVLVRARGFSVFCEHTTVAVMRDDGRSVQRERAFALVSASAIPVEDFQSLWERTGDGNRSEDRRKEIAAAEAAPVESRAAPDGATIIDLFTGRAWIGSGSGAGKTMPGLRPKLT